MEPQNKLRMEIIKDGKVLKYVCTNSSSTGREGYYTDTYKDNDGNIHYIDRLGNAIIFSSHSRRTGDGNMISFSINYKLMLVDLLSGCNEAEIDKLIKKCEYSLSKAYEGYKRENPELCDELYQKALYEKIDEVTNEYTVKENYQDVLNSLETALQAPRMQENKPFSFALTLKLKAMQTKVDEKPEEEQEL